MWRKEVPLTCELTSGAIVGVDALPVRVEVDIMNRLPATQIVGLPASAVREAAQRVRSAVNSSGFQWPRQRVVVNLAPADLRKEGTCLDLPIALGLLAAAGQLDPARLDGRVFAGELALSSELRNVRGSLSLAIMARDLGFRELLLPRDCAPEAAVVEGLKVFGARDLREVVLHLEESVPIPSPEAASPDPVHYDLDLSEVRGQLFARRALEIAAAGGHNLLMIGPPGCGKTMLASRLPTVLPDITFQESIDATRIHSVAGLRAPGSGLITRRPFRAPHHSISAAGMVGSASLRPGEISLAHTGVLFLDELPEFQRHVLELLRDPLENRKVTLSRARGTVSFPASFSLVCAGNPCPCGFLGHPRRPCSCTEDGIRRYRARMSGPLLDRIDLHVDLMPVDVDALVDSKPGESSAAVRKRVVAARAIQSHRYRGSAMRCNADLGGERVRVAAEASSEALSLLRSYLDAFALSGRAHARLLKVARTIADLEASSKVEVPHIAEAMQYRGWDRVATDESRGDDCFSWARGAL